MSVLSTAASVSSLLRDRAFESEAEDDEKSLAHFEEVRMTVKYGGKTQYRIYAKY
jgi:hypothetical protein